MENWWLMKLNSEHDYFEFIWQKAIVPAIKQCESAVDSKFRELYSFSCKNIQKLKYRIQGDYLENRENFKILYHKDCEDAILDISKLASVICFALIKNKVFYLDEKKEIVETLSNDFLCSNFLINYKVAFYASLNVLYVGMVAECRNDTKFSDIYQELQRKKSVKLYAYGDGENYDKFSQSVIKHLAFLDMNNLEFDFMMYSILLNGLKEYNYIYLKTCKKARRLPCFFVVICYVALFCFCK